MSTLNTKYARNRLVTVVAYNALIVVFVLMQLTREGGANWPIFFLQVLPLLIFIPGFVNQHYRVYSWLCFIILLYFVMAVMASMSSIATLFDYVYVALTVIIFISSMMAGRYAQRIQKHITD